MKKLLLIAMALMGTTTMSAQLTESPWQGSEVKEGTFYLYNVETGMWLQHNRRVRSLWTTHMQIDKHGFDVVITALPDGGYQLDPRFGHNHSINGNPAEDYGYMDTGRGVTAWFLNPVSYNGVPNTYEIVNDPDDAGFYNNYMNVLSDADCEDSEELMPRTIDNLGSWGVWQLVTKEERMADLEKATKTEPKDATWLIGDPDFANQNDRRASWVNELTGSGSGVAWNQWGDSDGDTWRNNGAMEAWSGGHGEYYQVLTGLPNGTYGVTVQGYYRDGSTSGIAQKHDEGTEEIRAWFFANDASQPFMSICESGATEIIDHVLPVMAGSYPVPGDGGGGNGALSRAANAFYLGYYKNPELKVVVSDGTLRIGVRKDSDIGDDWLVFDNFELTYYGSEIDLSEVLANLQNSLDEANAYEGTVLPTLDAAKTAGQAALSSTDAAAIAQATTNLQQALAATKAMNSALASAEAVAGGEWTPNFFTAALAEAQTAKDATDAATVTAAAQALVNATNDANGAIDIRNFYLATVPLARQDGVAESVISETQPIIEASESRNAMNEALEKLRTQRKIAVAETHPDVFAGSTPADGDYYIYNVGLKRFLCGGGSWGAHAYVGVPGVEVTLIEDRVQPETGEPYDGFQIDTHLNNGGESEFLNYGGYMDTPNRDLWAFLPVEGKAGVYNIARANGESNAEGQRMLLGYRDGTYGNIDTDMYGESNPNNQWKLVTRAERDELLATATNENPQDATYKIQSPGFNQREDISAWTWINSEGGNVAIVGRGSDTWEFPFESWNTSSLDLNQVVTELEPGWYVLGVQGYYRDGSHEDQILHMVDGDEVQQLAYLNADFEQVPLVNITSEIDKAPGYGSRDRARHDYGEEVPAEERYGEWQYIGEFPKWISEANNYFQLGLYKNQVKVEVTSAGDLMIGITKDGENFSDWVVVDNFRLTYYGDKEPDIDGVEAVTDAVVKLKGDGKTYNLAGQRVDKAAARGIYVRNGQKIVVK